MGADVLLTDHNHCVDFTAISTIIPEQKNVKLPAYKIVALFQILNSGLTNPSPLFGSVSASGCELLSFPASLRTIVLLV